MTSTSLEEDLLEFGASDFSPEDVSGACSSFTAWATCLAGASRPKLRGENIALVGSRKEEGWEKQKLFGSNLEIEAENLCALFRENLRRFVEGGNRLRDIFNRNLVAPYWESGKKSGWMQCWLVINDLKKLELFFVNQ
jgi:hypothetical protein